MNVHPIEVMMGTLLLALCVVAWRRSQHLALAAGASTLLVIIAMLVNSANAALMLAVLVVIAVCCFFAEAAEALTSGRRYTHVASNLLGGCALLAGTRSVGHKLLHMVTMQPDARYIIWPVGAAWQLFGEFAMLTCVPLLVATICLFWRERRRRRYVRT